MNKVILMGRIQTDSYTNRDRQKIYTTDVVVEKFHFLEAKNDNANRSSGQSNNRAKQQGFDEFNQSAYPFSSTGESIDIGDDDLPF